MKQVQKWSKEEIDLFRQGLSNQQIAEKTNRGERCVRSQRFYLRQKYGDIPKSKNKVENMTAGQKAAETRRRNKELRNEELVVGSAKEEPTKVLKPLTEHKNLEFIINQVPVTVHGKAKNVFIGKDKIEVNF